MPQKKTSRSARADSFTADERAAMKERAQELKAARSGKADSETSVLEKIATMPQPDRAIGELLHRTVKEVAPDLTSRLWYGMPAYAKDGKVLCFFQGASKFKTRYATIGFTDVAKLDAAPFWPVTFAVTEASAAVEAKMRTLLKKAVR